MNIEFYYPTMIRVIVELKDDNENMYQVARRIGINWGHLSRVLNTMYLYNLVDIDRSEKTVKFSLTNDGKLVREHFFHIHEIVNRNKEELLYRLHGYESKEELLKDVMKDLR